MIPLTIAYGKLRFTWPYIPFFRVPFKVIILDDDYEYMVVGYDGSTLGWVMSRNNFMDESLYENIMNELETKFKYDRNQFKKLLINDCVIKNNAEFRIAL